MRLLGRLGALVFLLAGGAAAADADPWRRAWGWGPDPLSEKYEELFDAAFPARGPDPFNRLRPFEDARAFERQFAARAAGASAAAREESGAVVLEVSWPGSESRPLDVKVERRRVLVRAGAASAGEPSPYRFRARPPELSFPLPAGARPEAARVERRGDLLRVVFPRG